MFYFEVKIFRRFVEEDCTYLGLCTFSLKRYTSLSQCYDFINSLPYVPDAIAIRKLELGHKHTCDEYKKDMDILLNFD